MGKAAEELLQLRYRPVGDGNVWRDHVKKSVEK
jgi:hypothetical protein